MNNLTQEQIDLIYETTHKDYKGILNGQKAVMYWENGTTYGQINTMPQEIADKMLLNASNKK